MFKEDCLFETPELGSSAVYSYSLGISTKERHLETTYWGLHYPDMIREKIC